VWRKQSNLSSPHQIDMKLSPTLSVLVLACALFVFSTYIPSFLLNLLVGTPVGAVLMLVIVLIVLQSDIVLGLATFLAVAALFLENRRRTVSKVTTMLGGAKQPFDVKELSVPAPNLVPGEVHPDRKESEAEDYGFEPTEESGKNDVESLGAESQDEKQPLETVPSQPSIVSEIMQQKGLATLN
jgi:hypothetical protein